MIQNRRDLGGIRTKDGHEIRPGLLIRSAHLFQAEETDLEGISAVIDLRTPGERQEAPDRTFRSRYLPMPIFDDLLAGISHEAGTSEQLIPDMAVLYGRMMVECGAVLWHCTEGKDRCGITSALVLEALGVDRTLIMADYLKTNEINLPKAALIRQKLADTHGAAFADSVYQAYIADERYLEAAWAAMGENYIKTALGIPEDALSRFRAEILK